MTDTTIALVLGTVGSTAALAVRRRLHVPRPVRPDSAVGLVALGRAAARARAAALADPRQQEPA